MGEPVKTPRPYHSPKHEAMRQATRQSVIAAGVAVPTVYAAFGNKLSILRALLDAAIDEAAPRPVAERMREQVAGVPDPATRVQKLMRLHVWLLAQTADVRRVIRGAAATDAEIQALLDKIYSLVYTDCQTSACLALGVASDDARTRRLADVMFAFTSSDLFDLLTGQRGWSVAEYERWAIQTVTAALPA